MRYLCRAKTMNNWVYGAYYKFLPYTPYPVGGKALEKDYKHLIITSGFSDWGLPRDLSVYEIDLETLGQCTGYVDCNNIPIYEGDILQIDNEGISEKLVVKWINFGFNLDNVLSKNIKVIGNIYDNPDLVV